MIYKQFTVICFSPSSRKKFVLFLIPCIKRIAMRIEDPIAEILAQTFPKIMQSLGHIMSDSNIKVSVFSVPELFNIYKKQCEC